MINVKTKEKLENGITLIALIITIVVLLILAGVSIAMLTGQNGILSQVNNAREKTDKATEVEKIQIAILGSSISINGYTKIDTDSFIRELQKQFQNQSINVEPSKDGSFMVNIGNKKYYINNDKNLISSENIIEINTVEELNTFRDNVNNGNTYEGKVVLLKNDITLDEDWNTIGKYDSSSTNPDDNINKSFMGTFDGMFHKIYGLEINSTEKAKGLFALVKSGTVKNIGIESGNVASNSVIGGIVGYAYDDAKIINCYNKANVTISSDNNYVGGIVGYAKNNVSIENCCNFGTITGNSFVGGICGSLENSKILNCYNAGNVNGNGISSIGIGGISGGVALNSNNVLKNCYNTGNISSNFMYNIGGIVGTKNNEDIIENNYFLENTVNGGNGVNIIEGTESKSTDDMKEIYNLLGDKFKKDVNDGYPILFWQ